MLFYLKHLKECVGALSAAILLLVPSQYFLDVLLGEIGWVYQAWNRIVWSKLVLRHLLLEALGKEDHDGVRERMAIVDFHVSCHGELCRKVTQSEFEFYLIPENHWWHFVIVFGCGHMHVSRILYFLFKFADILRLDDLRQLFLPFISQFLDINQSLSLFSKLGEEIFLLLDRRVPQMLEVLDGLLVDVKSVAQWDPLGPLNESFGLSGALLLVSGDSQVDIDIISSQSREGRSHSIISVARASFLLWTIRRQEVVITIEPCVTLHSILELKLNFGVLRIELEGCFVHSIGSQAVVSPSQ